MILNVFRSRIIPTSLLPGDFKGGHEGTKRKIAKKKRRHLANKKDVQEARPSSWLQGKNVQLLIRRYVLGW